MSAAAERATPARKPPRHAYARAIERYGLDISPREIRELEARLAAGEGMVLRRTPDGAAEVRVIRYNGELVSLVFGLNGFIWTFLPRDAPFKRLWRQR